MTGWASFREEGPTSRGSSLNLRVANRKGRSIWLYPRKATLGDYELRVYSAGGWNRLATSAPFKVVASEVRLTVDESKVAPGYLIHVRWAGLDSPEKDDWIGLFPKGGKDGSRVLFRATGGSASGDLSFTIPPATAAGEYEFRLYAHNSWRLVATSSPFQIISKPDQRK